MRHALLLILALLCLSAFAADSASNTTAASNTTTGSTTTNSTTTTTTTPASPTTPTTPTAPTAPTTKKFCPISNYYNGTGCTPCPSGCIECTYINSKVSCTKCQNDNTFIEVSNDNVGTCKNCTANCDRCIGGTADKCVQPASGFTYSPSTKGIFACNDAKCLYCNSANVCGRCNYGSRLENGKCTPCSSPTCAECTASVSTCNKCYASNHLAANNSCIACGANCLTCTSPTQCTKCINRFDLVNGACTQRNCSITGCNRCSANNVCSVCAAGMYVSNGNCTACSANCNTCTSNTACTACQPGFGVNAGKCVACPANCKACDGTGKCSECNAGFSLASNKSTCVKCSDNCATCMENGTCTTCNDQYKLIGTGADVKCLAYSTCSEGQFLNATGSCEDSTIDNCLLGDATTKTCKSCSMGWYAKDSTCNACQAGCHTCQRNSTGYLNCTSTFVPFLSVITQADKQQDATGYLCAANCATCNRTKACTQCMPNFLMTKTGAKAKTGVCTAVEQCPSVVMTTPTSFWCQTDQDIPTFASKTAISMIALAVAAIFAF